MDGIKFHRTKSDYHQMQMVSDRLCREHGLSVIRHPEGKGKNYSEWSAEQNGKPTNRSLIRRDIDRAIAASVTERDFYNLLESWGYEFKFRGKSGQLLERPSLRPKGAARFCRFDRLGEDYTVDEICSRILENIIEKNPFPEEERKKYHRYRSEHPPRTKAKGIAALYYYYCYELHIFTRFPGSAQRLSATVRQDLIKLNHLDEQTRFLGEYGIETHEDLARYREDASEELAALTEERNELRNRLKRVIRGGNQEEILEVKQQIKTVTGKINKIKNTLKICDSVEARASKIREELEVLYNKQPERKENADELFGRSGRADREDVPERR